MKKTFYLILAVIAVGLSIHYWPQTTTPGDSAESISPKATLTARRTGVEGVAGNPDPTLTRLFKWAKGSRAPKTKQPYQLVVKKPRARPPITLEETPEHLKPVVLQTMSWTPEFLNSLTAADVEILKQWYQQLGTNLVEKTSLTGVLGYVGDEEVVDMFKYALFEEFAGKHLTSSGSGKIGQDDVLFQTSVCALGLLASKYDSAYELIKQGTNPAFWDGRVKWTSRWSSDAVGALTSFCIASIGGTGRPDSLEFINQLKEQDFINGVGPNPSRRTFYGALVDAAFFNDMVAEHGVEFYTFVVLSEQRGQLEKEWLTKTKSGRQWDAWYNSRSDGYYLANKAAIDKAYKENRDQAAKRQK